MHKMLAKPITLDCFEHDDYHPELQLIDPVHIGVRVDNFLSDLEQLRQLAKNETDPVLKKMYWKELIRWLPESWLQTRTVTMNYENARAIYHQRQNHKQNEWSGKDIPENDNCMKWLSTLPYAKELIFYHNSPTAEN